MALDADLGSPTFNSFCTMAQATALLTERLHVEPWYTDTAQGASGYPSLAHRREAALIWATRLIQTHLVWSLPPASWVTIPPDVQRATAYYALALLQEPSGGAQGGTTGAIRRKRIGGLEIEYQQQTEQAPTLAPSQAIPADIQALLAPYGTVPDPTVKYADIKVF